MADRTVIHTTEIRDTRSLGEIVQDILRDVQDVIRSEFRLARTEMSNKARRASKAAGLLSAAAVSGFFALAALTATVIALLAIALPVWLSALIVTVLLAIAAGACFAAGRSRLKTIDPMPQRTVETIREDIEWAKHRARS